MAEIKDKPAPKMKGTEALNVCHNKPAIKLAGKSAIPVRVECNPSMVPFNSGGDISATKALSAPVIMAVYMP